MASNSSSGGGIGFLGALTLVFIVLKLIGTIDWSWWWVLSPTWIPMALVLPLIVVYIVLKRRTEREIIRRLRDR